MALIAVMLLMLVSLAIGLLSANSSRTELAIAHNQALDLRALAVAEAGVNMAKKQIENQYGIVDKELALNAGCTCATTGCNHGVGASGSGLEALGSLANATLAFDTVTPRCYRYASFGGTGSDGYYVRVEDNHDEPIGVADAPLTDVDSTIRVISHGVVGTAERTLVATFKLTPGTPGSGGYGIFGKNLVSFGGNGSTIDSYTMVGGVPVYGSDAVIQSNVEVDTGSSATVQGDLISGGVVNGDNLPTGTITEGAPLVTLTPIAACGPPYSGLSGIHFTGDGSYTPDGKEAGQLVCGSGCTLTLDPGTYCFGDVTINGGATLTVTGPTTINLTGQFKGGGSQLNNTTKDSTLFVLNSSYVGKQAVDINGGGNTAYITIYAPNGDVAVGSSGGAGGGIWGSIVGAVVEFTGGASYHQNTSGGGGGTPGIVEVRSWHEVQN